jgi:hypothetical protein
MLTLFQAPARVRVLPEAPSTPATPVPMQAATVDVGTLRAEIRELNIQLEGLQAQWNGLHSQLDAMLRNNPARPGVQQTWADVGVQMAKVKGDIAYREARIAVMEGRVSGTTAPPPPVGIFRRGIDPNVAMPLAMVLFMTLGLPVSIAWAKRIFRGKPQPAPMPNDYSTRLDNIERAIEAVAIEVERISEGQRFVTKIFAQRQDPAAKSPPATPEAASAEPRMLGAGPVEPIVVPQRERVRERVITPH